MSPKVSVFGWRFNRFIQLDPAVPVCWCGQPLETMASSGLTPMSSCPTQHLSEWPSRQRWVETYGQTLHWMTSPTLQNVWLEVKPLMFFFLSLCGLFLTLHFHFVLSFFFSPCFLSFWHCAHFSCYYSNFHLLPFLLFPLILSSNIHTPLLRFHINRVDLRGEYSKLMEPVAL